MGDLFLCPINVYTVHTIRILNRRQKQFLKLGFKNLASQFGKSNFNNSSVSQRMMSFILKQVIRNFETFLPQAEAKPVFSSRLERIVFKFSVHIQFKVSSSTLSNWRLSFSS